MFEFLKPIPKYERYDVLTEIRAATGEGEQGQFEGYIAKWDQVDSYNTMFARGAFTDTIKNDFSGMKVYYNHEALIGKPIEMREDGEGVFVRGQINLNTQTGRDAWEFLKDGTINGLSFRFRATKPDSWKDGVRVINKVEVREFGPVVFPAGDESLITDLRSDAKRSTDFNTNLTEMILRGRRYQLVNSLDEALSDIYYSTVDNESLTTLMEKAADDFKIALMDWVSQLTSYSENERSGFLYAETAAEISKMEIKKIGIEAFKRRSGLTDCQIEKLTTGLLVDLPEQARSAFPAIQIRMKKERANLFEFVCHELRDTNFTDFEAHRLKCLVEKRRESDNDVNQVIEALGKLTLFN